MTYLSNAVSGNMLPDACTLVKEPCEASAVADAEWVSVIGHPDTATVVGKLLGREVQYNRCTVTLVPGDVLYVAQYIGPRLPEGATELPEGAEIKFSVYTVA